MSSEKIEAFWVNATAFEVARVMAGETVEARFRDSESVKWVENGCSLAGWCAGVWTSSSGLPWTFCQVYREPSWYADKPDPGLGYRLLEKFPDEPKLGTDEAWRGKSWRRVLRDDGKQEPSGWYRRRIEPVEPKFAVGQMVKVVGPKQIPALEWSSVGMAQYAGTTQTIERVELLTNPPGTYYHLKGVVNWCFREDYLEAVEPEPVEAPNTYHYTNPGDVVHCPNGTVIVIGSKGFEVTQ